MLPLPFEAAEPLLPELFVECDECALVRSGAGLGCFVRVDARDCVLRGLGLTSTGIAGALPSVTAEIGLASMMGAASGFDNASLLLSRFCAVLGLRCQERWTNTAKPTRSNSPQPKPTAMPVVVAGASPLEEPTLLAIGALDACGLADSDGVGVAVAVDVALAPAEGLSLMETDGLGASVAPRDRERVFAAVRDDDLERAGVREISTCTSRG